MVFQLHVVFVKSNKWKVKQEYSFSACKDSRCKFFSYMEYVAFKMCFIYYLASFRNCSLSFPSFLSFGVTSTFILFFQEEVVSFPLYVEAIRFAFHEESMVRTAVRALTLNVYHGGFLFFYFVHCLFISYFYHSKYIYLLVQRILYDASFFGPVGDDSVNKFVTSAPHFDYFSNLVSFFREQCINLSKLVSECPK